jgi:hypothetical protein
MKKGVEISLQAPIVYSFLYTCRSGMAGHMAVLFVVFEGQPYCFSIYIPTNRTQASLFFNLTPLMFCVLIIAIPTGMR